MKLARHRVEKPWGRTHIPASFGNMDGTKIGEIWYQSDTPLPILVKWLFTSEKLSIQVHPDDAQARQRGLQSGKEECWYIVDAEPGAVLGLGTKKPLSAEELRAASLSGEIEASIDWRPVEAGDFFYVKAGTVHAIGAGITLVEVQQSADITYRLYDYGRPRELHLDDAVAVASARPYKDSRCGRAQPGRLLVDGPRFRLALLDACDDGLHLIGRQQNWIVPVAGSVSVEQETAGVGDCLLVDGSATIRMAPQSRALLVEQA